MTPTELALTYWPHAASLAAGALARPAWRKTWSAFVLLCRAVVAHGDGDDKTAVKDAVRALDVIRPTPSALQFLKDTGAIPKAAEPTPPPGTVKEWPKS